MLSLIRPALFLRLTLSPSSSLLPRQELQSSFSQICREKPRSVLEMLLLSDQPERFRKAQAFIRAQGLSGEAVAELVSSAVVQALQASAQELQPGENRAGLNVRGEMSPF